MHSLRTGGCVPLLGALRAPRKAPPPPVRGTLIPGPSTPSSPALQPHPRSPALISHPESLAAPIPSSPDPGPDFSSRSPAAPIPSGPDPQQSRIPAPISHPDP
ncbi:hypothetical protein F4781DRAFT_438307 [Annulohypoxylon bovei var. microspora]|nr:hypothetical protein F4781DRAFT_438307 [Annulohypoxylon bovei var. microspora]